MDNAISTDIKTYTALAWYTSYYNHTSGRKRTTIIIQELVPKGGGAGGQIERTSACISDRLYLEMCSAPEKTVIYEFPPLPKKEEKINKYYAEAATYARRASAGNFHGKNAKYKPIFHLDSKDFSPELRANLIERLKTSKESLHRVVEDAVFMIFRARHPIIFYQHIEADGLRWEFV